MWIDYLGYATMHYCQVMVIGFCGGIELMMMWRNANDGGPLEEAIHASELTIAAYYVMMGFSAVKCITGFYIYKAFKAEYHHLHGDHENDMFWNDQSDIRNDNQRFVNNNFNGRQDMENG